MQAWEYALELRCELEQWWTSLSGTAFSTGWERVRSQPTQNKYDNIGRTELTKLPIAPPYYVTPEMVDLLEAAAPTFPATEFHPTDLPSDAGFVLLARPLTYRDVHGIANTWSAFAWGLMGPTTSPADASGVHLTLYAHRQHDLNRPPDDFGRRDIHFPTLSLVHETPWFFGALTYDDPDKWRADVSEAPITEEAIQGSKIIFQMIHTFFILSQQKIAKPRDQAASRAVRRRIQRDRPDFLIPDVRVVTLRRYTERKPGDAETDYGTSREWSHRWIVDGHWRQQWYASEGRNKPIWIAPHVKGPENKPLVLKDSTYVWRR